MWRRVTTHTHTHTHAQNPITLAVRRHKGIRCMCRSTSKTPKESHVSQGFIKIVPRTPDLLQDDGWTVCVTTKRRRWTRVMWQRLGDRSGALHQALPHLDGLENKVWIEPPSEADRDLTTRGNRYQHSLERRAHRRRRTRVATDCQR